MWTLSEKGEWIRRREQEKINTRLKAAKQDPIDDYTLDLRIFGGIPFGHPCLHEFLLRVWGHQWPVEMVVEADGMVNYWLVRMAKEFCRQKRLILLGCASSGKSYALAGYSYTLWKSGPFATSVYLSTTSAEAGEARAFGTVKDLHNKDRFKFGKLISSLRVITLDEETRNEEGDKERDYRNCVKAVLIKPGAEGKNVVGTICGRKNRTVLWGPQPLTAGVLTPSGWTTIGELKQGDLVIGSDGQKQSVMQVHPVEKKPVFEIKFCDGSVTHSTEDHIWRLQDALNAKPILNQPLSYFAKRLHAKGTPRWSIPRLKSVEFEPVPKPFLSPYIVGVLLGDGSIKNGPHFWSYDDPDVVTHVTNELPEGHTITSPREGQFYITHTGPLHNKKGANKVTTELKRLGLLGTTFSNKFVPKEILFGSRETRIKVLQGLLDTDGCVLHSTIRFTSKSDQLRKDVIHLVRSLGEYARESLPWTVVINIEGFAPFRAQRKLDRMRPSKLAQRRRAIESITQLPEETEVRCITVSNRDGLYVTDDFVVTHNCDELPFMDTGVLDARVNLFSNDFGQFIGVGNGPEEGDPLYIDGEPFGPEFPDGWRSVNPEVHEGWKTKTGYCLYFNGTKSPNLMVPKGKKPVFPSLMDWNKLEELKSVAGGDDTPIYWRQVIGLAPGVDVPDKIITFKLLESNGAFSVPVWQDMNWKTVAGLDLGFRDGGDPCVIDFGRVGTEETGRKILEFQGDGIALLPLQSSKEAFEKQISRQVVAKCKERGCHDLALDVTGDGGILLQHIEREAREQEYRLEIVAVSFSGTADDAVRTPGDQRKPTEIYANKVSQIWTQFRIAVTNGVVRGCQPHHRAVKELCGRRFSTDEKKRFLVEKKSDYKKRLRHSPDRGDARCLCAFMAIKVGLSGAVLTAGEKERERKEAWAAVGEERGYSGHGEVAGYSGW